MHSVPGKRMHKDKLMRDKWPLYKLRFASGRVVGVLVTHASSLITIAAASSAERCSNNPITPRSIDSPRWCYLLRLQPDRWRCYPPPPPLLTRYIAYCPVNEYLAYLC